MKPLYIAATDTLIYDPAHRYVHPQTGEVYGRTDWENQQKLDEVGAVPLVETEDTHTDSMIYDGDVISVATDGKSATLVKKYRNMTTEEVEQLRQSKIVEIKQKASMELRKSDWQMIRAIERAMLTVLPAEDQTIANDREAIRDASDEVEADIMMAVTAADIKSSADVDLALTAEAIRATPEK